MYYRASDFHLFRYEHHHVKIGVMACHATKKWRDGMVMPQKMAWWCGHTTKKWRDGVVTPQKMAWLRGDIGMITAKIYFIKIDLNKSSLDAHPLCCSFNAMSAVALEIFLAVSDDFVRYDTWDTIANAGILQWHHASQLGSSNPTLLGHTMTMKAAGAETCYALIDWRLVN